MLSSFSVDNNFYERETNDKSMEAQTSCQLHAKPVQPKNSVVRLKQKQNKRGQLFIQSVELPNALMINVI